MGTSLGPILREARLRAGLKRADLARRVGIDPGYLMRIESGKHDPPFSTVVRLAAAVGASLDLIASGVATGATGADPRRTQLLASAERHLAQAQAVLRELSDAEMSRTSATPRRSSSKKGARNST